MLNLNLLTDTNSAFNTPKSIDSLIIEYFNNLGWWGNLILIFLCLLVSIIYGGIIGYQREINGHAAGLRTHILISLGSALIMVISVYGVPGEATRDPMRLAAAGVTGMGFLGAGSIIKNGLNIKGLTTAASIWVTMAIGMASGAGYFVIGLITTLFTLICLASFTKLEKWVSRNKTNVVILASTNEPVMSTLLDLFDKYNVVYKGLETSLIEENDQKKLRVSFKYVNRSKKKLYECLEEFKRKINDSNIQIQK
ncbi:MAG: MgtC/SapB family protein [Firmicutes bacterium]|uniref:MgtC/SapB family protein n=1 Tax=Candidatus Onthovivens merdipullorum TaxID=2840889 RepID=A0A9D9DHQ8_9BACL|nr:MgtC/SapB family protein [Candidatus Onthovivens merdipullorum]